MAYTTIQDVSNALKGLSITSTTTPDIDTVNSWILENDSWIDEMTGKLWASNVVTSAYLDYDGSGILHLPHYPIISVEELKYETQGLGADTAEWSTLTEGRTNDFIIYKDEGDIKFFGDNTPSGGYQNINISYTHGMSSTPLYIKRLSTLMTAKQVISATINSQAQEEGGAVSVGNISVSDPTIFQVNFVKSMNDEIESILKKLGGTRVFRNVRRF